jgi:hypothetical protein
MIAETVYFDCNVVLFLGYSGKCEPITQIRRRTLYFKAFSTA